MTQIPPPEGLPPAYEPGQFGSDNYHGAYEEERAATTAGEQGRLLQSTQNNSDTDIDSLLESDGDEGDMNAVRREMEEMEIVEPRNSSGFFSTRASMASMRIATSLNTKIIKPVQRMLDPIASFINMVSSRFDSVIARFGNPLILKRLLYLFFVFFLIFIAFHFGLLPGSASDAFGGGGSDYYDLETLVDFLKDSANAELMKERLEYLSSMPHLAGTAGDLTLAKYFEQELYSFGMKQVGLSEHSAYITYPNETESAIQLQLLGDNPYTASMKEDLMYESPTNGHTQPRPFHAFSASGEVQGSLVYVNYGTKQDFEVLAKLGISTEGCILIMKNGKMAAGLKAKLAEEHGAVGVITFSDRQDPTLPLWPQGPDYPAGAVERNSMAITALYPGDLLSPEFSSFLDHRSIGDNSIINLPKIPVVPVSWNEVKPFLDALKGLGTEMIGSDVPHLDGWWSGNQSSPEARLVNYPVIKRRHPIWNIIGKLEGREQRDLAIVVGAKRDSWCYGAVGTMSGTTVLLEVARVFTLMSSKLNWMPLRSIYFASWDGGDQNLAGTTEWVEYNADGLRAKGVVYINLDDAISGNEIEVKGHPMLQTVMKHVLDQVTDPISNQTIGLGWSTADMKPFDEANDCLPFTAYAGMPSIQLSFKGKPYPKHSCFDSFEWMKTYGDPTFEYHRTMVDIVSKLLLRMANDPLIQFDLNSYADSIEFYVNDLKRYAQSQPTWNEGSSIVNFDTLADCTTGLRQLFKQYVSFRTDWLTVVSNTGEPSGFTQMRWAWNGRFIGLDKVMLDGMGMVPGRSWFKHPLFGPQLWHPTEGGYLWGTFPGIRDAIEKGDWNEVKTLVGQTAAKLMYAVTHGQ